MNEGWDAMDLIKELEEADMRDDLGVHAADLPPLLDAIADLNDADAAETPARVTLSHRSSTLSMVEEGSEGESGQASPPKPPPRGWCGKSKSRRAARWYFTHVNSTAE